MTFKLGGAFPFYHISKNKTYLEMILGKAAINSLKAQIASKYSLLNSDFHLQEYFEKYPSSTTANGGAILRLDILRNTDKAVITSFIEKYDSSLISSYFRTTSSRTTKISSSQLASLIQRYIQTQIPQIEFLPLTVPGNAQIGTLYEAIPGPTLEECLSSFSVEDYKQTFCSIVDRFYQVNQAISTLPTVAAFKKEVQCIRSSLGKTIESQLIGSFLPAFQTSGFYPTPNNKFNCHAELGLFTTEELCHCDLVPSNIIMNLQLGPCFIDWSNATFGELYSDLFQLQQSLGLSEDPEINQFIDNHLTTVLDLSASKLDTYKSRVKAKTHLLEAQKIKKYLNPQKYPLLTELQSLHEYHLQSAVVDLESTNLDQFCIFIRDYYLPQQGYSFNHTRFQELSSKYSTGFPKSDLIRTIYKNSTASQEQALEMYQNHRLNEQSTRRLPSYFASGSLIGGGLCLTALMGEAGLNVSTILLGASLILAGAANFALDYHRTPLQFDPIARTLKKL